MVLHYICKILKEVVPMMEHPSQTFLAGLEEDLIKLIMKHGQLVRMCILAGLWVTPREALREAHAVVILCVCSSSTAVWSVWGQW